MQLCAGHARQSLRNCARDAANVEPDGGEVKARPCAPATPMPGDDADEELERSRASAAAFLEHVAQFNAMQRLSASAR